eukprot:TRINITY_DN4675_c0_g1_i1.p1 TRINITY_DN4675_c0_g1~~TRINITY_DN4675_c0_g1_i1.p1  ORF type:complete len:152 (-),score=42.71 TRINITY_DN4675_c0_g1_i1:89-544(-)
MINSEDRVKYIDTSTEHDKQERLLIMIILGMISINNNSIDNDILFEQLHRLGLESGTLHPVFGEWEKLIETTFTKQKYIEKHKTKEQSKSGKVMYVYSLGDRAKVEIGRRNIQEFVANMFGEQLDPVQAKAIEMEEEKERQEQEQASQDHD